MAGGTDDTLTPSTLAGARVLVVDDDRAVRTALEVNLRKQGMVVRSVAEPAAALDALREAPYDVVLTDVKMPGSTGIELQRRVRESWPDLPVVVMTGYGSVADAVAAMKGGATDYVIKPIEKEELLVILDRALQVRALRAEVVLLRREVEAKFGFDKIIGTTPAMVALYEELAAIADTSAAVLLQGPTGTGKELLAHAIHYRSRRAAGPFVRVNCAAIPDTLLESELFGHEKGSFTGAIRQHLGKFEQADGGTLLLDEIGEIEPHMQVKLLRALENGEFQRVGGSQTIHVDVRVIAATNKDLAVEAREGRFRKDLFYRLNVMTIRVPALRERRDDIPLLVDHFAKAYAEKNGRPVPRISRAAIEQLRAYAWPGNVRQLEHLVERAVILNRGDEITAIALPEEPVSEPEGGSILPPLGTSLQDALIDHERRIIIEALREAGGVQAKAARRLGLSRSNLNYRISRLDIQLKDVAYE